MGNYHSITMTNDQPIVLPSMNTTSSAYYSLVTSVLRTAAVETVAWSYDNVYVTCGDDANIVAVYSFNGTALAAITSQTLSAHVLSVRWHPSAYYVAVGIASATGNSQLFIYQFNPGTGTLTATSSINLSATVGTTYTVTAVYWSRSGSYLAVMTNSTTGPSYLLVYSVASGVATLVASTQIVNSVSNNLTQNVLVWDPTSQYIAVGMAEANENTKNTQLQVYYFNGSTITPVVQAATASTYVVSIDWNSLSNTIVASIYNGALNVYSFSSTSSTLTQVSTIAMPGTSYINQLAFSLNGYLLATVGNVGTGVNNIYDFNQTTSVLTQLYNVTTTPPNTGEDIQWSPNNTYVAYADSSNIVSVYKFSWATTDAELILNNVNWTLNSDLVLNRGVRFQGTCALNAAMHSVNLSNGYFILDLGATLSLRNVFLQNVSGTNISCVSSTGVLNLYDVVWLQSGNFAWLNGTLNILGDTVITGTPSVFSYQSSVASTISSNALWYFDSGMTFSYAPSVSANNLISFADRTARWYLYEATLLTSAVGLQLFKGTLVIDGVCSFVNKGTSISQAITFGDGVNAANDLTLKVLPGSGLLQTSGFVQYKNVAG